MIGFAKFGMLIGAIGLVTGFITGNIYALFIGLCLVMIFGLIGLTIRYEPVYEEDVQEIQQE